MFFNNLKFLFVYYCTIIHNLMFCVIFNKYYKNNQHNIYLFTNDKTLILLCSNRIYFNIIFFIQSSLTKFLHHNYTHVSLLNVFQVRNIKIANFFFVLIKLLNKCINRYSSRLFDNQRVNG